MIDGRKMLKTLPYFCQCLMDPLFEVFEVLANENHPEYLSLHDDLSGIDPDELAFFVLASNVDLHISETEDKEYYRRAYFIIETLQKSVAKERLNILLEKGRTQPYTSENLKGVLIDQNNLISLKDLSNSQFGLSLNDYFYQIAPSIVGSNSSYWTTVALFQIVNKHKINIKVRLDPFIEKHRNEYNPMGYRMWVHGKPLDWSRIKKLRSEEFGQWVNEHQEKDSGLTEFVWRPDQNEVHFTCEELPSKEYVPFRGSRYFHAIFDRNNGNIIHCDGAIRVYDNDELKTRSLYHVKNPEVRKIGKRIKIFQVDDILPSDDFGTLVSAFFVWNRDVQEYFA